MIICPKCGNSNPDDSCFCEMCGSKLVAADSAAGYNNPFGDDEAAPARPYYSPFDDDEDTSSATEMYSPFEKDIPSARTNRSKPVPEARPATKNTHNTSRGYKTPEQIKQSKRNETIIIVAVLGSFFFLGTISTIFSEISNGFGNSNSNNNSTRRTTAATSVTQIQIGKSSSYLSGMDDYHDTISYLEGIGFTGVNASAKKDIVYGVDYEVGSVAGISIDSVNDFGATDTFPSNAFIVIYYHSCAEIESDASSSYVGTQYRDVVSRLHNAGFYNIELEKNPDLVIGLLASDGEVESITIDGSSEFNEGDRFPSNVPIVIRYHTYP